MSVEQRRIVDFVGVSKADGHVILTIADHLPFDDEERLVTLQNKLNDYLAFIESGEIYESYPDAKERQVEISIQFKHQPNERALEFLQSAGDTIREAGFGFSYEVFGATDKLEN
jgi:hypothetical protein